MPSSTGVLPRKASSLRGNSPARALAQRVSKSVKCRDAGVRRSAKTVLPERWWHLGVDEGGRGDYRFRAADVEAERPICLS